MSTSIPSAPSPYVFSGLLIDGRWRAGAAGTIFKDIDPYTGRTLVEVPQANVADIEAAYASAKRAQRHWANTMPGERAEVLRRAAAIMDVRHVEIVDWLIQESGSVRIKAELEWSAVRAIILEASTLPTREWGRIMPGDIPGKEHRIYRVPVGVVSVISPWNWPMHLSSRATAPALALGNAVVLKPASETVVTGGLLLGKIFQEAGLPPGVLNVVSGDNHLIGDPFVLHPASRVISFTGSTPVGRRIAGLAATGKTLKKAQLELGGNNASIVCPSADLDLVLRAVAFSAMGTAGQRCTTLRRLFVHESVYDKFVPRLTAVCASVRIGDPREQGTLVGPLIDKRAFDGQQKALEEARALGASIAGGERVMAAQYPDAYYVRPAIVEMPHQAGPMLRETFAPILYVVKYKTLEEALQLQNAAAQGLTSSIFTTDMREAEFFLSDQGSDCGIANVNIGPSGAEIGGAFGGEKESGCGREAGSDAWKGYMRRATNTVNYGRELPLAQGVTFEVS